MLNANEDKTVHTTHYICVIYIGWYRTADAV